MSEAVLKSTTSSEHPDRIHAHPSVIRYPNGVESGNWQSRGDERTAEYVRVDLYEDALAHLPPDPDKQALQEKVEALEAEKAKWQELAGENFHHSADIEKERFSLSAKCDQLAAHNEQLREALEEWVNVYKGWSLTELDKRTDPATRQRLMVSQQALNASPPEALSKRDGEVLALKEALEELEPELRAGGERRWANICKEALTDSAQTTQAIVERIQEEERVKCLPTNAALDVLNERQRQRAVEGWSEEHDDQHDRHELIKAAVCYLFYDDAYPNKGQPPPLWPFEPDSWEPSGWRRDTVKGLALGLAELERLDRATAIRNQGEG